MATLNWLLLTGLMIAFCLVFGLTTGPEGLALAGLVGTAWITGIFLGSRLKEYA